MIAELLELVFTLSLVIFMVGNLSAMGLQLDVADAVVPLKDWRFVLATLIAGFVFSPALGYLLTLTIPMERPFAIGLLLLAMAPSAPFLPLVVKTARGDLPSAAGLMLLASVGTIVVMPLAVPYIATTLAAGAWTIAKPLLFLVLLPLGLGMIVRSRSSALADQMYVHVKAITTIGTVVFLIVVMALNFRSFLEAFGSGAFAVQILFVGGLTAGGYLIASGLRHEQRIVLSLGMCTRNIGAAAAIVGTHGDQRIMVMLVIGTLATVGISFGAANLFARQAARSTH